MTQKINMDNLMNWAERHFVIVILIHSAIIISFIWLSILISISPDLGFALIGTFSVIFITEIIIYGAYEVYRG